MEEVITGALLADAGVTALASTRVSWVVRPQGAATPSVTLHRISGRRDYHFGGASGLVESRLQVDCWAATYPAVKALARAVRDVLSGMTTASPPALRGLFIDVEADGYEPGETVETSLYRVRLDARVWHDE